MIAHQSSHNLKRNKNVFKKTESEINKVIFLSIPIIFENNFTIFEKKKYFLNVFFFRMFFSLLLYYIESDIGKDAVVERPL